MEEIQGTLVSRLGARPRPARTGAFLPRRARRRHHAVRAAGRGSARA